MGDLQAGLQRARERASYSQDDVGAALGVSRAMVSYWESGSRVPNGPPEECASPALRCRAG